MRSRALIVPASFSVAAPGPCIVDLGPDFRRRHSGRHGRAKGGRASTDRAGPPLIGIAGRNSDASQLRVYAATAGTFRVFAEGNPTTTVGTGVYGKWMRVNAIHNASANRIFYYINGTQRYSGPDGGDATGGISSSMASICAAKPIHRPSGVT